jgi:myo-inositol-1(or 4)-monophosphatase
MKNNSSLKRVATRAAKKAGDFLLKEFDNFDRTKIEIKSPGQILTQADLASEKIILQEIKENFPSHAILSEESGENGLTSEYLWVIDPIDGTTNFSFHNPLWSISIGLVKNGEIVLGVVYAPKLKEIFVAEKGKGATLNGKPIKVSNILMERSINTFCHGGGKKDIEKAMNYAKIQKENRIDCRQLGSAAIELAYVATGRVESLFIPGLKTWDVAAGVLLVREAGGWVTDFDGSYFTLKSRDVVASNGIVHKNILKTLEKI